MGKSEKCYPSAANKPVDQAVSSQEVAVIYCADARFYFLGTACLVTIYFMVQCTHYHFIIGNHFQN